MSGLVDEAIIESTEWKKLNPTASMYMVNFYRLNHRELFLK